MILTDRKRIVILAQVREKVILSQHGSGAWSDLRQAGDSVVSGSTGLLRAWVEANVGFDQRNREPTGNCEAQRCERLQLANSLPRRSRVP